MTGTANIADQQKPTPTESEVEATKSISITQKHKFVYTADLEVALNIAFQSNENIILFGKGGHSKSEFTEKFFEEKGINPFIKTMGSGTTTESLFGGMDLRLFNESGKLEYLVENSFMNSEYVVFEELFDAPDYILEQLKDILTSKQFRNGNQIFPIKTKFIVCCTNKTREEFGKNDSLKALLERFPLEYKVEWNSYTKVNYEHLFQTRLGAPFKELSHVLEALHKNGTTVSPRTAIKAAKIIDQHGYDALQFIADFAGKNSSIVKKELQSYSLILEIDVIKDNVLEMANKLSEIKPTDLAKIKDIKKIISEIDLEIKKLNAKKVPDELINQITSLREKTTSLIASKHKEISLALESENTI